MLQGAFSPQSIENLLLLSALGAGVALLLARLHLPVVTGLLLAGALLGPKGLGIVRNTDLVQVLSKIGVVMLMFTIGLQFSPRQLQSQARVMALGGLTQVGLTVLAVALGSLSLDHKLGQAVFLGFVVAQSSTAIVLRSLHARNELHAPHGRLITGALLFQDLTVVPMLVAVPLLAGGLVNLSLGAAIVGAAEAMAILSATWIGGRWLVPAVFRRIAKLQGDDVFLLSVLALILASCWLSAKAGLSTALGAFLAGILLADANLGEKTLGQVLPFREISASVFFVGLGLLFDAREALRQPHAFAAWVLIFTLGKAVLAGLAARLMGFPPKVAVLTGLGLGQFSEFGYVLLQAGLYYGLIKTAESNLLLSAGIASMLLTPVLFLLGPRFLAGERILAPLERLLGVRGADRAHARVERTRPDLLLLGWDAEAARLSAHLARLGLRSLALDSNPETVAQAQKAGYNVLYGDALSPEVLNHAGVDQVRGVVSLLPIPLTAAAAGVLQRVRPDLTLLAWIPDGDEKALLFRTRARVQVLDDVNLLAARIKALPKPARKG
jgi:CPA2 family monovalent cation:H+ antiporter-2